MEDVVGSQPREFTTIAVVHDAARRVAVAQSQGVADFLCHHREKIIPAARVSIADDGIPCLGAVQPDRRAGDAVYRAGVEKRSASDAQHASNT